MTLLEQLRASLSERYRLDRELGGGGMAHVFLAEELALARPVVIKVLRPELAAGLSAERFAREVHWAAKLQQANIVPVLATGDADGHPYYTMPYVAGQSLRARVATGPALAIGEVLSILRDVARALTYAHAAGVVHRDIKPENVLMSGGTAMVTDFGIAKAIAASRTAAPGGGGQEMAITLTEVGVTLGTPAYMAPEQAAADPATDHRADLYAFGCLGYELLTRHPPFTQRTPHEVLAAHLSERPGAIRPERPDVPGGLEALLLRCLEKAPAARPQSAAEVLEGLDAVTTPQASLIRQVRWRRPLLPALLVIALVAAGLAWFPPGRRTTGRAHTIAVIPLTLATSDTAQEYFADGITDELTTALAQVPSLAVINRGSAYQFKGPTIDPKVVTSKLGVDHIVELRVRRTGPTMRIDADLVNSATGVAVWSRGFVGDIEHVRATQDEIVSAIITALGVAPGRATGTPRREPRPEAFEAYVAGRAILNRATTKEEYDRALDYFTRAAAIDSAFAEPWAAASLVYQLGAGLAYPVEEAYRKADSLSRRGVALDDQSAEAHASLGWATAVIRWDWTTARREIERALALSPSNALAHLDHAFLLIALGDLRQALEAARTSRRLDPAMAVNSLVMEYIWIALGEPDSAIAVHRRLEEIHPGFVFAEAWVTDAYRQRGLLDSALALDRAASAHEHHPTAGLVLSLAALGRQAEALAAYREMVEASKRQVVMPEMLARAAMGVGDRNAALGWLERAVSAHYDWILCARFYPDLRPLLAEPRYQALLDRMGLPR